MIDRHIGIGIRYKEAVYMAYWKELTTRLEAARAAANGGAEEVTILSLTTPRDQRVLITHVIGDFHEKIVCSGAYEKANIATGTWMSISHCIGEKGSENLPEDKEVSVHNLPEYGYSAICSRTNISKLLRRRSFGLRRNA